ncbi:hypothetical protein Q1695_016383 [Nippostrongylus brasiliensis]|nr:hypothetical protein Q1695_016383 [Nippostrongylus brasiliensis]
MALADNASECLPRVISYDVEASQGAAASECARAAPDGGSSTLAQARGLKWFMCRKLFFTVQNTTEDFGGGAQDKMHNRQWQRQHSGL